MNFQTALEHILRHEGGLVDHPKDPGKITKYGISLRAYPDLGREGIRNLTREQAASIYKADYWNALRCDELPVHLRLMAFDCAVNQGAGFAMKALQGATGSRADGVIGPRTIEQARRVPAKEAVQKFAMLRFVRYLRNPNWRTFGEGWMSRLFSVTISTMEK